jgi:uncharacterized membrane protein YsdA (DUF1294 family)
MAIINYPFDFITLAITYKLLEIAIRTKRHILIVAIVDMACSYALAVILHSTFMLISGDITTLSISVLFESHLWLCKVVYGIYGFLIGTHDLQHLAQFENIHLFPMIVSTFVPVFVYMSIFISISIFKPFFWLTARLFHAISEKEDSAFKQIGTVVSLMMAAFKAIYDVGFIK